MTGKNNLTAPTKAHKHMIIFKTSTFAGRNSK